jgi:hypothetical protein
MLCVKGVWRIADQNAVYLYDARGTRYANVRLMTQLAQQEETRAA